MKGPGACQGTANCFGLRPFAFPQHHQRDEVLGKRCWKLARGYGMMGCNCDCGGVGGFLN